MVSTEFLKNFYSSSEKKAEDSEPAVSEEETSEEEPKDEVCLGLQ